MSHRVHIIGVGSPFGDDRLGWAAAEALQRSSSFAALEPGRIEITILDRPGAMLLAHWRGADDVILIDAVRSGAAPGTLHRFVAGDLASRSLPASSHGFGIVSALELARALGALPKQLLIHGVEIDPSCSDFCLSIAVAGVLPVFIKKVEEEALALAIFPDQPFKLSAS